MGKDYIPEQDRQAAAWMRTFANGIAADPDRYMLAPSDVEAIQGVVADFRQKLAVALAPSTRTKGVVRSKDESRAIAEKILRPYAQRIKLNGQISNAAKIDVRVPPPHTRRTRRGVPGSRPLLNVVSATHGRHTLRYQDSDKPGRGMPFGAVCLQVFRAISTNGPVSDPTQAQLCGCFTRSPAVVTFVPGDCGKTATYFARWASRRGEFGCWSMPASFVIAA
jgi:hypothetical protein